jgi:hypothetical protein
VGCIYFNSSCRKRFNSWTICLLRWWTDRMLWGKMRIEGWKI